MREAGYRQMKANEGRPQQGSWGQMGEHLGSSPPADASARKGKNQSGLPLQEINAGVTLTSRAYEALRQAIAEMPIYDGLENCRLDERALANDLGTSRTPVREALLLLENEGVVQTIARRGVYVIRKTKAEIIAVILASAALESMAARLAAERASDAEIRALRSNFPLFSE
jgi:DNA-binding GntR family transcriptional regulator